MTHERVIPMKKNQEVNVTVSKTVFPFIGIAYYDDYIIRIKEALEGEKFNVRIVKIKNGVCECKVVSKDLPSPMRIPKKCKHFGLCGGCSYQDISYEDELLLKKNQVIALLEEAGINHLPDFEIIGSPKQTGYRNKMEFSFGDEYKGGPLSLGMRRKGSFYEVEFVNECQIIDDDYKHILRNTLNFFKKHNISFYNNRIHEGTLRHLVVRKSESFGDLLINLVIAEGLDNSIIEEYKDLLLSINLTGKIAGLFVTINDALADAVILDNMRLVYGKGYFYEELHGLKFKVYPESFFQTNTKGAELLYKTSFDMLKDLKGKTIYDLYSGAGTITQIIAKEAKKVIGIELVEEAVDAAVESSIENNVQNCLFIKGDVLKKIEELQEKPDIIILDPPRSGINPKALKKIVEFNAKEVLYISCNPKALQRELSVFLDEGYTLTDLKMVDMFPGTVHVETVVLLNRIK